MRFDKHKSAYSIPFSSPCINFIEHLIFNHSEVVFEFIEHCCDIIDLGFRPFMLQDKRCLVNISADGGDSPRLPS